MTVCQSVHRPSQFAIKHHRIYIYILFLSSLFIDIRNGPLSFFFFRRPSRWLSGTLFYYIPREQYELRTSKTTFFNFIFTHNSFYIYIYISTEPIRTFGQVSSISKRIGSPSTITSCLYLVSIYKYKQFERSVQSIDIYSL